MKNFDEWVEECIEARLSAALGERYTVAAVSYESDVCGYETETRVEITVFIAEQMVFRENYSLFYSNISGLISDLERELEETDLKL